MSHRPEPAPKLITVFPNPAAAPEPTPEAPATVDRLTWRLDDVVRALGVSRRVLERERSAGRFPKPDLTIGRMPLWRPETIREWVAEGGGQ